jgi:hypothetical protein
MVPRLSQSGARQCRRALASVARLWSATKWGHVSSQRIVALLNAAEPGGPIEDAAHWLAGEGYNHGLLPIIHPQDAARAYERPNELEPRGHKVDVVEGRMESHRPSNQQVSRDKPVTAVMGELRCANPWHTSPKLRTHTNFCPSCGIRRRGSGNGR